MEPEVPPPPPENKPPHSKDLSGKLKGLSRKLPDPKKIARLFEKIAAAIGKMSSRPAAPKAEPSIMIETPEELRERGFPYKKWIALGVVGLVIFFGVKTFLNKKGKPKVSLEQTLQQNQKEKEGLVPIKGFRVGRFNFEDSLNALGTIKGAMEFKLSFEVPGTVSSINYREGERYEEGALLISLRQDDILLRLKRAQAEFNKSQTQGKIADEKVKDHEKLFAMGAIPKTTLDSVKLESQSAKFEAESSRLEVKANEAMLEKSNLYSPSAGMIGDLNIEEGETITPNTLLGTHIMTEFVYAEFGVVERDVNKIALGQKAKVFVDAFPDKTFEGVIENIAPVVSGTSRTATVRVRVENPDRLLLPGMFARIRILLYSKKNTLIVPTDAVQGNEGQQFIYIIHSKKEMAAPKAPKAKAAAPAPAVKPEEPKKAKEEKKSDEPDTVEKRAITVGYTRPDYSQVDAGLSEGEVVAISGLERLEDGKKVRLLEVQEAET